jgi:hypothetical protein
VVEGDQKLIVAPPEFSRQGEITSLDDHSFTHHVPELLLGDPVILAVIANDQCCLFYFHTLSEAVVWMKKPTSNSATPFQNGQEEGEGSPLRKGLVSYKF